MKDNKYIFKDLYVRQKGCVVTIIQTIGEYDSITRREFPTEAEAYDFFLTMKGGH